MTSVLDPGVLARADQLSRDFAEARPFRHVVIEPFLDAGFLRRVDGAVSRGSTGTRRSTNRVKWPAKPYFRISPVWGRRTRALTG